MAKCRRISNRAHPAFIVCGGRAFTGFDKVGATGQQDTTITRDTGYDYFVWLIPEFLDGDQTNYTRYDGETGNGEDTMAFVAVGANSQAVTELKVELENLNEKLDRILKQAEVITGLALNPGEK